MYCPQCRPIVRDSINIFNLIKTVKAARNYRSAATTNHYGNTFYRHLGNNVINDDNPSHLI